MTKAERTRNHIVEQAALLFNQKGVAGTTVDDILLASRIAKGSLYKYFPDKEALAYEAVDYLFTSLIELAVKGTQEADTAYEKLVSIMGIFQNSLNPPFKGGCPMLNFGVESDDTDPIIQGKVKKMLADALALIQDVIEEGIRRKQLSKTIDPKTFSLKMLAILEGGMMLARATKDNKTMEALIKMLKADLKTYTLGKV